MRIFTILTISALALVFIALPNSSAAGPCNPVECSKLSTDLGRPFCKSNSVYIAHRDYHCSGFDCIFTEDEKLIDECKLGCLQGICLTCDDTACRRKSGYFGLGFCKNNDVYRQYRDYQCRFEQGCVYEVIDRQVEDCVGDCRNGQCGCDAVDCVKQSGFYGDAFCKADNDAYREYRKYSCTGFSFDSRCTYERSEAKIADCLYSCSSGECVSLCQPDCASKTGYVGGAYCQDGDVYRKYREYYCVAESCVFNEKETRVQDCKRLCVNTECVDSLCPNTCDNWGEWVRRNNTFERTRTCYNYTSSGSDCILLISYNQASRRSITTVEKAREISFDIDGENIRKTVIINYPDTEIYNGLFFGENSIAINAIGTAHTLKFIVSDTNELAPLVLNADNEKIYSQKFPKGSYEFGVNKEISKLKISALSSGWQFWTRTSYRLEGIEVNLTTQSARQNDYDFTLDKELEGFEKASLTVPENITATINGEPVRADSISRDAFRNENKIEFMPAENTRTTGKAVLKVWYLDEK